MTHVKIRTADAPGVFAIEVDGVDMSMAVLADGFGVDFPTSPQEPAQVHMTVAADVLDIDLPDAAVKPLRVAAPVTFHVAPVECPACKAKAGA